MDDLLAILRAHAARYPLMQPCDAVKLLYQNEFGGGHLIVDPKRSLARIREEAATFAPCPLSPDFEDIGGGLVRAHLTCLTRLTPEQLNDAFVRSAHLHTGSLAGFLPKLSLLRENLPALGFSFSPRDLADYLAAYAAQGYPMVSHSETYRAAYHPAYRVVLRSELPTSK